MKICDECCEKIGINYLANPHFPITKGDVCELCKRGPDILIDVPKFLIKDHDLSPSNGDDIMKTNKVDFKVDFDKHVRHQRGNVYAYSRVLFDARYYETGAVDIFVGMLVQVDDNGIVLMGLDGNRFTDRKVTPQYGVFDITDDEVLELFGDGADNVQYVGRVHVDVDKQVRYGVGIDLKKD